MRVLVTAGPTREYLDPVRFFSNASSGKMGYALAAAAVARGWRVDLVSGPVSLPRPEGAAVHPVVSATEMMAACEWLFPQCALLLMVAAVADYRPREFVPHKTKKTGEPLAVELVPTVDILRTLGARRQPGQTLVGFAAETDELETYARRKLMEKNCDWIVANDISQPGVGMEADDNAVILLGRDGRRLPYGPASKSEVARFILAAVAPPAA